ncbi:Hpt domain-containing protein [Photobacterium frigidiphilum]|uniref:Hpt domain-containing protein n=1 Tax=Photobacterium frigidiphilum TaxID=264736 RepID=UPI003D12DD16
MINYTEFSSSMDNDDDMIEMIIELYSEEHGDDIHVIQNKYANQDIEGLFHTIHSLRGVLLTLCEDKATLQLETIENLCKRGEKPDVQLLNEALEEVARVNQQILTLTA